VNGVHFLLSSCLRTGRETGVQHRVRLIGTVLEV
jgi:hypothetical protein